MLVIGWLACAPPEKDTGGRAADTGDGTTTGCDLCDQDADGWTDEEGDCDDDDPGVYPGAAESCDGQDNDCDDEIDEGVTATVYADADGDGFGDPSLLEEVCTADAGWVTNPDDCDDTDATVNPDAQEVCDGVDQDCDGQVDEDLRVELYADADGDGFGDAGSIVLGCEGDAGTTTDASDCDDADPDEPVLVHEGESIQAAVEVASECVFVYAGEYRDNIDFEGKSLLVWGVEGPDVTTVIGAETRPVVRFASGERDARLSGFTLTGGMGEGDADGRRVGGGVLVFGAAPTLDDLVITDNQATQGGGIAVSNAVVDLDGVELSYNRAEVGGGLYVASDGVVTLTQTAFLDGTAVSGGGAYVSGNVSGTQVLFARNTADTGDAVDVEGFVGLTFATLVEQQSAELVHVGEAGSFAVEDGLFSGNGACVSWDAGGSVSVAWTDGYGCVDDVPYTLSEECPFVDAAAGDYRLVADSPCWDVVAEYTDCEGTSGELGAYQGESGCWD